MQDEKEIKKSIKDLEAHLAFLADEATKKAGELSSFHKQIEAAASDIERHSNIVKELKTKSSELETTIGQQNITISKNNEEIVGHQDVIKSVLATHDKEKRTALKELEKINQWILDGKGDKEKLEVLLNQITSAIKDNQDIVDRLLEKQKEYEELIGKVSHLRADVEQLQEEKHQLMQDQIDIIDEATQKTLDLEQRATDAEERARIVNQECDRKIKDLEVYEQRVADAYQTSFPGRKVKV